MRMSDRNKINKILLIIVTLAVWAVFSGKFDTFSADPSEFSILGNGKRAIKNTQNIDPTERTPTDKHKAENVTGIKKKSQPSVDFLRKNPLWKPIRVNKLDPLCREVLGLSDEEFERFGAVLGRLSTFAGYRLGRNSLVVTKPDGAQLAYIPPDETAWFGAEKNFRRELISFLGEELTAYVMKSSAMDLDLLTGNFGRVGRMVEIFPSPKADGISADPNHWTAFIYIGNVSSRPFAKHFDKATQDILKQGNAEKLRWQDLYTFSETPDFLSGLIAKK